MMGLRYLAGVTTLSYDAGKCVGCGRCVEVCPHEVFKIEKGKAVILDKDACIECGACKKNCAFSAINVRAGVGCAAAVIGILKRKVAGCGSNNKSGCC